MGTRREARELALQALYQLDMAGEGDPAVPLFWSHADAERTTAERAEAERESAHAARGGSRAGVHPGRAAGAARTLDRRAQSARALDGPPDDEVQAFARELVDGVAAHRERIDALIAASAEHWRLPRLSRVDLSLLRLATFELLARADIPASVTIDEAIEIARRFGSEDSPAFVNGVLDHIAQVLGVKEKPKSPE